MTSMTDRFDTSDNDKDALWARMVEGGLEVLDRLRALEAELDATRVERDMAWRERDEVEQELGRERWAEARLYYGVVLHGVEVDDPGAALDRAAGWHTIDTLASVSNPILSRAQIEDYRHTQRAGLPVTLAEVEPGLWAVVARRSHHAVVCGAGRGQAYQAITADLELRELGREMTLVHWAQALGCKRGLPEWLLVAEVG